MGIFSKALDIGKDITGEVEDIASPVAKSVYQKAGRHALKGAGKVAGTAAKPVYRKALRGGVRSYDQWSKWWSANVRIHIDHPELFDPRLDPRRRADIYKQYGITEGDLSIPSMFDPDNASSHKVRKVNDDLSGLERIGLELAADPVTYIGAGAVLEAGLKGGVKAAAQEAVLQSGIPSVYKALKTPWTLAKGAKQLRNVRVVAGLDATAEAIKLTEAERFKGLNEVARADILEDINLLKGKINAARESGETIDPKLTEAWYDELADKVGRLNGNSLESADFVKRQRRNDTLLAAHEMVTAHHETEASFRAALDEASTAEKLVARIPVLGNALKGTAPARYNADPVFRTAVQRMTGIDLIHASMRRLQYVLSASARGSGMLADPMTGKITKGAVPLGNLEPTVLNLLEHPEAFKMTDDVKDVVDATLYAQSAMGQRLRDLYTSFDAANPGVLSKETRNWINTLGRTRPDGRYYVHRVGKWVSNTADGAQRLLDPSIPDDVSVWRRIAAFVRAPVPRVRGKALPKGWKAVEEERQAFGAVPSISHEQAVTNYDEASRVLFSQDPGEIIGEYGRQIYQKFMDDTVYGPILKKMGVDPKAVADARYAGDIAQIERGLSHIGRIERTLMAIKATGKVTPRTVGFLKRAAASNRLPEELQIGLRADIQVMDNLLQAEHEFARETRGATRALRETGEHLAKAGEAEKGAVRGPRIESQIGSLDDEIAKATRRGEREIKRAEKLITEKEKEITTLVERQNAIQAKGGSGTGTARKIEKAQEDIRRLREGITSQQRATRADITALRNRQADLRTELDALSNEALNVPDADVRIKQGLRAQERAADLGGAEESVFRGRHVYHGTPNPEFEGLPSEGSGFLGRGTYVSESPTVATEYAGRKAGGRVFPLLLDDAADILDFEAPVGKTIVSRITAVLPENVQQLFLNEVAKAQKLKGDVALTGRDMHAALQRSFGFAPGEGDAALAEVLRAAGYDAVREGSEGIQYAILNPDKLHSSLEHVPGRSMTLDVDAQRARLQAIVGERLNDLKTQWKPAAKTHLGELRKARKSLIKAQTVFDLRQSGIPGLSGTWFDRDVAARIAEYLDTVPKERTLSTMTALQAIPQSLMAGADFSVGFLQGMATAASNPAGWLKTWVYAARQFVGDSHGYAGYLQGLSRAIDPQTGRTWLDLVETSRLSLSNTEMYNMAEFLNAVGAQGSRRTRAAAEFIADLPWNKAFAMQRNVAATELFKAQVGLEGALARRALTDEELRAVAQQVDLATGVVSSRKLGIQPTQASLERLFGRFGAQWFRSQTGRVVQAFRTGSIEGRVARRLLFQQLAATTAMYVAFTELAGGEIDLDPTSRDFMTVYVGKSRIRPGGIYVGTMRTIAQTVEAVANGDEDRLTHIRQGDNPLLNYWRNGAPVIGGIIADTAGVNADAAYRSGESPLDPQNYLPFAAQAFFSPDMQNPTLLDRAIAGTASGVGLAETPQTATDVWKAVSNQYATENGYPDWDSIPIAVQEKVKNDNKEVQSAWAAKEKWFEKYPKDRVSVAADQAEKSRLGMGDTLAGLWARVESGQMTKADWRKVYGEFAGRHAYLTDNIFGSLSDSERATLSKDKQLLQDRLAEQYQGIQPEDLNGDGELDELDWKAWREARNQWWVDHPEAEQYAAYIKLEYPNKVWEKLDNPIMRDADRERRVAMEAYDEYISIPKYRGLSTDEGAFLDQLIAAKAAASREIGALLAERGVDPRKIRIKAAVAWKYALAQLQANGVTFDSRMSSILKLAVTVDRDDRARLKLLSNGRLNYLRQNGWLADWYPTVYRDTGVPTNYLVRLGIQQGSQGQSLAERARIMVGSQ